MERHSNDLTAHVQTMLYWINMYLSVRLVMAVQRFGVKYGGTEYCVVLRDVRHAEVSLRLLDPACFYSGSCLNRAGCRHKAGWLAHCCSEVLQSPNCICATNRIAMVPPIVAPHLSRLGKNKES